jgi:serine protease AprX
MRKFQVLLASILTGALLSTPVAMAATTMTTGTVVSLDSTQKIHPLLQYGANVDAGSQVRVIVQKTSAGASATSIASQAGAQVIEEFKLIPAFVATLPQGSIASLAQNSSVRYISPDASVQVLPDLLPVTGAKPKAPPPYGGTGYKSSYTGGNLLTTFPIDTGASGAWTGAFGSGKQTGTSINVAVVDSGIDYTHPDLAGQVYPVNVNKNTSTPADGYGHGTHVAALISGHDPAQQYLGIAPNAGLISVKIADDTGLAFESDLLRGLDWVDNNRAVDKIRVLNLSVSSSVPESYATSPVDAAVERLWYDGVTVVASAGNLGSGQDAVWYAPGNDPLVITVGCLDENQTTSLSDDSLCSISSHGVTEDGFAKPDLVAPGRKIYSALSSGLSGQGAAFAAEFPDRITADGIHIRLSGTSMAAPQVAGAAALVLQRHSTLTNNQLKQILKQSTRAYPGQADGAGMLNIGAALKLSDKAPANAAQVPAPGSGVLPPSDAVTMLWDGSNWGSSYFDGARWSSSYFDGARWGSAEWDGARWTSAYWDGARWSSTYWDGARWSNAAWDSETSLD